MMRPRTNRLLMLLVGAAISGCASQTDRSSSGGGDKAQIEYERVGGSVNAVTSEELERRAAAKAAAESAAPPAPEPVPPYEPERESVQYVDRPLEETPPKPTAVASAPKDEALPDFPITKYELPDERGEDEAVGELGPQEDESESAQQDAALAEESSVGETTEYADDEPAETEEIVTTGEVEDLGPVEDESVSEAQDDLPPAESPVGETTEYADDEQPEPKEIVTTGKAEEVEDLGPLPDESGTVSYPEDKRPVADNAVGEPRTYADEPVPKAAPSSPKMVSVNFETEPLFNFDKSAIRGDQGTKLDEFISSLDGTQYESIAVTGHADRIGNEAYNQKLSERRANAVKAYLVRKGVPAGKVQTEGRGESEPVTGDTCAKTRGKALISCLQPDRRVDVSVSATKKSN